MKRISFLIFEEVGLPGCDQLGVLGCQYEVIKLQVHHNPVKEKIRQNRTLK
jgi:hypothetical protein